MTIALPFWDRKQGEIQTATAEQQKLLAEIEKTRLEIAGAVTKATKDLELAHSEFSLYTPAFLDSSRLSSRRRKRATRKAPPHSSSTSTPSEPIRHTGQLLRGARQRRRTTAELEAAVGVPLNSAST